MNRIIIRALSSLTVGLLIAQSATGAPIRDGFNAGTLNANDDGSTSAQNLGFTANFFGINFSQLYVNNNGNVTFDSALSSFTPFDLTTTGQQIIAPFFGDVDTRTAGNPVTYGTGTVGGQSAFGANWLDVSYYSSGPTDQLNQFQLVLVDRSDIAVGDFDIEFNYEQILWETGNASSGAGGLGGNAARVGFSNGTGAAGTFYELLGSAQTGAFLDNGLHALVLNELNSINAIDSNGVSEIGRYVFQARNGSVVVQAPEPGVLLLLGSGLIGLACSRRRLS